MLSVLVLALLGAGAMVARGILAPGPAASTPVGPASPASAAGVAGLDEAAALAAADKFMQSSSPDQAVVTLRRAIDVFPERQALRLALAKAYLFAGKPALAFDEYRAAIRIGPATPDLLFDAGTVANTAGKPEDAADYYTRAQFANPKEWRYPLYLAFIQAKLGRDEAAIASLTRVVNMNPDLPEAWGTLAELELKANQASLAAQHVAKARALDPIENRWRLVSAKVFNRLAKPAEALAELQGLPTTERSAEVLAAMAASLALQSKPADAAALYEQAFAERPREPAWALEAARWRQRAGDTAAARDLAARAAALGDAEAKALLNTLTAAPTN